MRIIAGIKKGTQFKVPAKGVRPTTDYVREALFSTLGDVSDETVLDLFGGSGALSFEALSRGAKSALIIEKSRQVYTLLKENIKHLKFNNIQTILKDSYRYLKAATGRYSLIFVDPPYQIGDYELVLKLILQQNLLAKNGRIICEGDHKKAITFPPELTVVKEKKYGNTRIWILTHTNIED